MKKGIFYAVGVGCGDPMDMSLKAKAVLEAAEVIVRPVKEVGAVSSAFSIAAKAADLRNAEILEVVFPMKAHKDYRSYLQSGALDGIYAALEAGKSVAMVTLGDVSVYSTASYVRQLVAQKGYATEVIAGIPSFSSAAAKAQVSLCENGESLEILPGIKSQAEILEALEQFDNLVILKAGRALSWLLPILEEKGLMDCALLMRNVGMENEYIGRPNTEAYAYFSTLLIKKGGL